MVSGEYIPGVPDAFGLLLPRRNKVTYDLLIQKDVVLFFSSNSTENFLKNILTLKLIIFKSNQFEKR